MKLNELPIGKTFVLLSSVRSIARRGVRLSDNGQPIGLGIYRVGAPARIDDPEPSTAKMFVISNDGRIHQMDIDTEIVPCG